MVPGMLGTWLLETRMKENHPNWEKAWELFWLIKNATQPVPMNSDALLVFAKQCSMASLTIERLLNETTPEVSKEK